MSTIQITYSTRVEIDLHEVCESLGIFNVKDVTNIVTTGNILEVTTKDGETLQYEFDPSILCDSEMDEQNPTTKIV